MKLFVVLQQRFGFTRNEIKAVLILSIALITGAGIQRYRDSRLPQDESGTLTFDYSRLDSEFIARSKAFEHADAATGLRREQSSRPQKPSLAPGSINLNTATQEELVGLPGIGEQYAKRIVQYREENGPFSSVDELSNVRGIGKKKLEKMRAFLRAE
jgi:comEA protein